MIRKLGCLSWKRAAICAGMVLAVGLAFGPSLRIVWSETTGSVRMIPAGTTISVRLLEPLDSKGLRPGDLFEARVVGVEPSSAVQTLPPGTLVEGRCLAAREAEGEGSTGYLRLTLSGMRDSWGHIFPLETTTLGQWGSEASVAPESPHTTRPAAIPYMHPKAEDLPRDAREATVSPETNLDFILLRPALVPPTGYLR